MGPQALKELRTILANAKAGSYDRQASLEEFAGYGLAMLNRLDELEDQASGRAYMHTPGLDPDKCCLIDNSPSAHNFKVVGEAYPGPSFDPEKDRQAGWRRRLFCTRCGATLEIPDENPEGD